MNHDFDYPEGTAASDEARLLHEAKLAGAVTLLLDNADGVYFLRWLVNEAGLFTARYPDEGAAFREGKRLIGAAVFALVVGCGGAAKFFEEDFNG